MKHEGRPSATGGLGRGTRDEGRRIDRLVILGSTGSIGTATLDVVARHPDRFTVVALGAGRNAELLARQITQWRPRFVAVQDDACARRLRELVALDGVTLGVGDADVAALAALAEVDTVVAAIVGAAGLRSTVAAIQAGKRVALANKESMVVAGPLVQQLARTHGAEILPVDSEHSAVFQALAGHRREDVRTVTLTASGGPFRDLPENRFAAITVADALKHPNWSMGAKITIDSATLMNKGLELIEARWLFDLAPAQLDVLVHRESIVHALVEYADGAVMAQLAMPDMRAPIAYALGWPQRLESGIAPLKLAAQRTLTFAAPDTARFPCLRLARAALDAGGTAPTVLNAANEIAVHAFLQQMIRFPDIASVVEEALQQCPACDAATLDAYLAVDTQARQVAQTVVNRLAGC